MESSVVAKLLQFTLCARQRVVCRTVLQPRGGATDPFQQLGRTVVVTLETNIANVNRCSIVDLVERDVIVYYCIIRLLTANKH